MLTFSPNPQDEFWQEFIDQYWEKAPVLIDAGDPAPPLTLAETFAAVTHMPERGKLDRFWLAKTPNPQSLADFARIELDLMGPQANDVDFAGFFQRLSAHSFGINIHWLEKGAPAFGSWATQIASAMAGATQPPIQHWQTNTFFGNYRATPFGIHRDEASVFSFTLLGQRTYYTWPPEAFEPGHPDLSTVNPDVIERHLPDAERFDVAPGSLVYWPSNRWHLVTSPGEPFVVAQISAVFKPEDVGQG